MGRRGEGPERIFSFHFLHLFLMINDEWVCAFVLAVGLLFSLAVIAGGLYLISAKNEAAAFNRLTTGPKVTTWDAIWLDLRVEAQ